MLELEPKIWVPVQVGYTNNVLFCFRTKYGSGAGAKKLKMLEPVPKKLDENAWSWSQSLKFE